MADNFSDDSSNDGLVPVWSDSDDSVNHVPGQTPPQSPRVLDPYINPDDVTEIPLVLEGWRRDIGWPDYQHQPFDQRDYPITGEPAQQSMPIVVAKLNEIDDRLTSAVMELENKADYQDITITRQGTRDVRRSLTEYGQIYNDNLVIIDNIQTIQERTIEKLALSEKRRKATNARLVTMGRTMARLSAELASTSRARKKKAKKA